MSKVKVLSKNLTMDSESFQPVMRITSVLDIPLELVQDTGDNSGIDELYRSIGKTLVDAATGSKCESNDFERIAPMNNMRELLKHQLDICTPTDGDYLKGVSIEDAVEQSNSELSKEVIRQEIERKVKIYADHKGEKWLFVAEQYKNPNDPEIFNIRIEIFSVWESEIEKYANSKFIRMLNENIPLFERDL